MRVKKLKQTLYLLVGAVLFYSCQQVSDTKLSTAYLDLPQTPYHYGLTADNNDYIPTLGRVLFYDSRVSANNSVSCASCHKQALAFSDNVPLSTGFTGQLTSRNSLPIQNLLSGAFSSPIFFTQDSILVSNTSLFWDGRETLVDAMVLRPITNHVEMGITLDELTTKLLGFPEYRSMFKDAYGTEEITAGKIGVALGQFISSITSSQTKFDMSQSGNVQLSAAEENGRQLFLNKYNCNTCHHVIPGEFNIYQFNNFIDIGLDQNPKDQGRADVTNRATDLGKFKIPNLRNVALTAPYMHDGRFTTLSDVIDHYSVNIANSPNLDTLLRKNGSPRQMLISQQEKEAIISFLNTLTDYPMITDPKFSSPFKMK